MSRQSPSFRLEREAASTVAGGATAFLYSQIVTESLATVGIAGTQLYTALAGVAYYVMLQNLSTAGQRINWGLGGPGNSPNVLDPGDIVEISGFNGSVFVISSAAGASLAVRVLRTVGF